VNPSNVIRFHCPHCGVFLSVPQALAGVTGPCPTCTAQITAPLSDPITAAPPVTPSAIAPLPTPSPAESPKSPLSAPEPTHIRPEPRGLATPKPVDSIRALDPADVDERLALPSPTAPFPEKKRKPDRLPSLLRLLIPVSIVLIIAVGFFQLSKFLKTTSLTQKPKTPPTKTDATPLVSGVVSATAAPPRVTPIPPPSSTETLPSPNVAGPTVIPDTPPIVEPTTPEDQDDPAKQGLIASGIVEQFLAATTIEERMMYVSTRIPQDQLKKSILSIKWPTAQITPGAQISHPAERLTEYYFEVRFGENSINFPRKTTLLVHQRGTDEPKIVIEPLLDTAGGRLAEFAKKPSTAPQDFHVIMDARIKCFDDKIPNSDKKCTFFLRAHITGEDIATAYANELSETRKEFDNPLNGLKWKNPMPVIITLQWNTTEDYTRPFLEVIEIKSKSWVR
jgi:hypothetical protein